MHRLSLDFRLSSLVLTGVLLLAPPAFADETDRLFQQGTAAFKAGKNDDALSAYQAAWKLRKTQDLAASMAQVELVLGKQRDAAEHLAYALHHFPVSADDALRKKLEAAFTEAKTKVAELRLRLVGDVSGATVRVDGVDVATAPFEPSLFVTPGRHTVALVRASAAQGVTMELREGESQVLALALAEQKEPLSPVVLGGLGGLAAVGVGAGIGTLVAMIDKDSQATALRQQILAAGGQCRTPSAAVVPPCQELRNAASAADVLQGVSVAAFVIGGAALAGLTAYAVLPRRVTVKPAMELVPVVAPTVGGLIVRGRF